MVRVDSDFQNQLAYFCLVVAGSVADWRLTIELDFEDVLWVVLQEDFD
jgi:hypothetical protein